MDRKWEESCVPILINDVQWDYHLSRALFSEKIFFALLTIHHMFTQQDFKVEVKYPYEGSESRFTEVKIDIFKQLPTAFADGVVAWLKVIILSCAK